MVTINKRIPYLIWLQDTIQFKKRGIYLLTYHGEKKSKHRKFKGLGSLKIVFTCNYFFWHAFIFIVSLFTHHGPIFTKANTCGQSKKNRYFF